MSGLRWSAEQLESFERRTKANRDALRGVPQPVETPPAKPAKPRKYRNEPITTFEGHFDSKREYHVWLGLLERQRKGEITELVRQVEFPLIVNDILVATYRCDAAWKEEGVRRVADVKSEITRRDKVYQLKKKLMRACHGIEIVEIA